jgi:hypothetical protein
MNRLEEMRRRAQYYHYDHPEVWELFVRFAFQKIDLGYGHYGAKAIMERVRWETDRGAKDPALKVNDHYTAFYARRFHRLYPRYDGFFRNRVQKSVDRPATGLPEPNRYSVG